MKHRLLVAYEVILFLESLGKVEQRRIRRQFLLIAETPDRFADFQEPDSVGRMVDIHLCGKFAIKYWADLADRQVKILDLHLADE